MTDHFDADSLHSYREIFHGYWPGQNDRKMRLRSSPPLALSIAVGVEVVTSALHQIALLTLVNTARRTFLAGVEVFGIPDCATLVPLAKAERLVDAVRELGGTPVTAARPGWPGAIIGSVSFDASTKPTWQLTWATRLATCRRARPLHAPGALTRPARYPWRRPLAAAICAAEVFAHHAGDHPMAGKQDFRAVAVGLHRQLARQ